MFRFTTRDLLWLMVVVGLACGWWADRKTWPAFRDREKLTKAASDAGYHFERNESGKGYVLLPYPIR